MIISEEEVILNETQEKLLISGWGKKVSQTPLKRITYLSGGEKVQGYLSYPPNIERKYPLIIWNRGGSKDDGKIDDFLAKGIFGEIASWGYAVLASNYRKEDEFGGREVEDVLSLITLSDELPFCDNSKIGMEGWSRGGMMTYLALSKTDRVRCAVIISGLSDLCRNEISGILQSELYSKIFGQIDRAELEKRKRERSAVCFAEKINKNSNILLIHGTSDEKISYLDSVDMFEKLKANGINCRLELIEGGDHYLRKNRKLTSELRKEWFNLFLNS